MTAVRTLVTAEEFLQMPDPGDGRRYELLDGEVVELTPPGGEHGVIAALFTIRLGLWLQANPFGILLVGDPGVILQRKPDRVRAPDVCYFRRDRLPGGKAPRGYLEVIPDLVVEVVSPGDRAGEIQQKVAEWLAAGVRLVWLAYPVTNTVIVYDGSSAALILREGDVLEGGDVLPGFSCEVSLLFS
ncbi:MAG: Uma2 family endonuclease [Chloroflexi bacterium]|nr:Uma2 family endonuclease [Chloroflexota bacterium]